MRQLWAPWRMDYIRGKGKGDSCVFCQMAAAPAADVERRVIARSRHTFAALNRYPYTYGHTMVIPYEHLASPEDLSAASLADLMLMSNRVMRALREIAEPPAFNIGANIGAAAGAGIASHFHFHIVPRWDGDHSFMECIGGTRTVPDSLSNIATEMGAAWQRLYGAGPDPKA